MTAHAHIPIFTDATRWPTGWTTYTMLLISRAPAVISHLVPLLPVCGLVEYPYMPCTDFRALARSRAMDKVRDIYQRKNKMVVVVVMMMIWLSHWGRVKHICVGNLTINGSDNGLSPGRRQAIIWINARILLIGPLGTNFSGFLIEINTFSIKKRIWKCRLRNGGHFVSALTNSSPSGATYMRQWIGSALVQIMVCRLVGAKPLCEPMMFCCKLDH